MSKIIRLTESDLTKIVRRVINEEQTGIRVTSDTIRDFLRRQSSQVDSGTYRVVKENGQDMLHIEYVVTGGGKGHGRHRPFPQTLDIIKKPKNLTKTNGTWRKYFYATNYGPEIELF